MSPGMFAPMRSSLLVALARLARQGILACGLALALGFPVDGLAHSDSYLDTLPSPHGGQVRMAGPLHLDLVVQATAVEVYVTDHAGSPRATHDGTALLRIGPDGDGIKLQPAGANRFAGTLAKPLSPDAEFTLFVRLSGEDAQSARFSPHTAAVSSKTPTARQPRSSSEEKAHAHHAH